MNPTSSPTDTDIFAWRCIMWLIVLVNSIAWFRVAYKIIRTYTPTPWISIILSEAYVIGCTYRAVYPVMDTLRISTVDHFLNSVFAGRCIATVAELSFVAQIALILNKLSHDVKLHSAYAASLILVPLIVCAEIASWYGVITLNNFGHVIEEFLWKTSAGMLITVFLLCLCKVHLSEITGIARSNLQSTVLSGLTSNVCEFIDIVSAPVFVCGEYRCLMQFINGEINSRTVPDMTKINQIFFYTGLSMCYLIIMFRSMYVFYPNYRSKIKSSVFLMIFLCSVWCYHIYMELIDIPMYYKRWLDDQAHNKTYLSITDGFHDVRTNWTVSTSYDVWSSEIPWMTLYFSLGPLCSTMLLWYFY